MAWSRVLLLLAVVACDRSAKFECKLDEPRFCSPRWASSTSEPCKDCSSRDVAFCAWFDESIDERRFCFPTEKECSLYTGFDRKSDCIEITVDALPNEWIRNFKRR